VQTIDKCLILSDVIRGQKVDLDHIPHAHAEGRDKDESHPSSALHQ
jgi:hypothetical protein